MNVKPINSKGIHKLNFFQVFYKRQAIVNINIGWKSTLLVTS